MANLIKENHQFFAVFDITFGDICNVSNLIPLFLNKIIISYSLLFQRIVKGTVWSPHESILFAPDKYRDIAFMTFSEPYITSVLSAVLLGYDVK